MGGWGDFVCSCQELFVKINQFHGVVCQLGTLSTLINWVRINLGLWS